MDPNNFQPNNGVSQDPNFVAQSGQQPHVVDVTVPQTPQQPSVITPQFSQVNDQQIMNQQVPAQFNPVPGGVVQPNMQQQAPMSGAPQQTVPGTVTGGPKAQKKPKFLIIIVVAIVLLGGMTAAALVVAKPKAKNKTPAPTTQTSQSAGPLPAKALDVEQSNNSINQDISGVNDDDDLPPSQLDDKALGL